MLSVCITAKGNNNAYCYITNLLLNKMSTVIG